MVAQTLRDFKPMDLGDGVDGPNKKTEKIFSIYPKPSFLFCVYIVRGVKNAAESGITQA